MIVFIFLVEKKKELLIKLLFELLFQFNFVLIMIEVAI